MKRNALRFCVPLWVSICLTGCDFVAPEAALEKGASTFEVSGQAFFTGTVIPPVKMALFYTGDFLYTDDKTFPPGTTAALASNVTNLGNKAEIKTPFTLKGDLDGYRGTNATATLLMWVDLDNNDMLDVGERTSRVLPNLETNCPVFGSSAAVVPVHYIYDATGDSLSDIAQGWNQSYGGWYVPAANGANADIENELNFPLIP